MSAVKLLNLLQILTQNRYILFSKHLFYVQCCKNTIFLACRNDTENAMCDIFPFYSFMETITIRVLRKKRGVEFF